MVANLSVKSVRNLLVESAFFANLLHEKLHNCRAIYQTNRCSLTPRRSCDSRRCLCPNLSSPSPALHDCRSPRPLARYWQGRCSDQCVKLALIQCQGRQRRTDCREVVCLQLLQRALKDNQRQTTGPSSLTIPLIYSQFCRIFCRFICCTTELEQRLAAGKGNLPKIPSERLKILQNNR